MASSVAKLEKKFDGKVNFVVLGTQFTCFTSTKVQILTPEARTQTLRAHAQRGITRAQYLCQYLYFCTSKASKLSRRDAAPSGVSIVLFSEKKSIKKKSRRGEQSQRGITRAGVVCLICY